MRKSIKGGFIGGLIGIFIYLIIITPILNERIINYSSYDISHFIKNSLIELILFMLIFSFIGFFITKKIPVYLKGAIIGSGFGFIVPIISQNFRIYFLLYPIRWLLITFYNKIDFNNIIQIFFISILFYSLIGFLIGFIKHYFSSIFKIKKIEVILLFILIICININFLCSQEIDDINISINSPAVIRVGTETIVSLQIKNLKNDSFMLNNISFIDNLGNIILSEDYSFPLYSVKEDIINFTQIYNKYLKNNCSENEFLLLTNLSSIIKEKTFIKNFQINLGDFNRNLTINKTVLIKIKIFFLINNKQYFEEKSFGVLYSGPLPKLTYPEIISNYQFLPGNNEAVFINKTNIKKSGYFQLMSSLPSKPSGWYAGDNHLHESTYGSTTAENSFWGNMDSMENMVFSEKSNGMDWIIFTDHSADQMSSTLWNNGYSDCTSYSNTLFKCLFGQEMSVGGTSFMGSSHYLAYPYSNDYLGYIDGTCNFLWLCRDPQTVINDINNAEGMGFIAHPYISWWDWKYFSSYGFTGLEIFNAANNSNWESDDAATFNKWQQLLNDETNPLDGFTVGIGNSDAHTIGDIGSNAFTYCYMDSLTTTNILQALKKGHCVVSNGPLISFSVQNKKIGEKTDICSGNNLIYFEAYSNQEFGTLKKITIIIDGIYYGYISLSGYNYSGYISGLNLLTSNKYIQFKLETINPKYLAISNPLWINVINDSDCDGILNSQDSCPNTYGTYCHGCPQPTCQSEYSPICPVSGAPYCNCNITCFNDSDCGANSFIGNKYCSGNNIKWNYQSFTCNNKGTCSANCNKLTTSLLINECNSNQTCNNGSCCNVSCFSNIQCNDNNFYTEDICINPGMCNSKCINLTDDHSCGIDRFIGDKYCFENKVMRNYTIYHYIFTGTINGSCVNTTSTLVILLCNTSQVCSNATCINIPSININSPSEGIFNKKTLFFNISSSIIMNRIEYMDYFDQSLKTIILCKKCSNYHKNLKFNDGNHSLLFTAVDSNNTANKTLNFFIDSTPPKITKTFPAKNKISNGTFFIEFTELNPLNLSLSIWNSTNRKTVYFDINKCQKNKDKYFCSINIDINEYKGQVIYYSFKVIDIAGNFAESKNTFVRA